MTAAQKQEIFREVVESLAKSFAHDCNSKAESFSYNTTESDLFINRSENEIRQLGVNFFRHQLNKRSVEASELYMAENLAR